MLDKRYLDLVLDMTAEGKLSFLISDDNICYGANYPFSHVVINDDICLNHSIGTIFQLLGRAGRVGQSWVAYAHVGSLTTNKIMNYIKGLENLGISIEAENLNKSFNKVKEEIIKDDMRTSNIIKLSEVMVLPPTKKQSIPPQVKEQVKEVIQQIFFEPVDSWENLMN